MGIAHITALEAMGPVGCTIHFGPEQAEGTPILREADAVCAVTLTESGQSTKEAMLYIQEQHEKLPDYQRLRPTTSTDHLFGDINFMADLVSRNKLDEFYKACTQMGITPRRVPTKQTFIDIFDGLIHLHLTDR